MATKLFYSIPLMYLTINAIAYPSRVNEQPLFPAVLVFGDSSVDTGNNNNTLRADHSPYGRGFPTHKPTDRFFSGKLVPDFLAHTLDLKDVVPPYLDPSLANIDLLTSVSFGSAGSGFDDLTTVPTRAIPMSKQADYFRSYKERVSKIIGETEAKDLIKNALVIISAGTNDFTINYYDLPTIRRCRRMVVAGLLPVGCLPRQITSRAKIPRTCLDEQNSEAMSYNNKLLKLIPCIQDHFKVLRSSMQIYIYTPIIQLLDNSQEYGTEVTDKGCVVGQGTPRQQCSVISASEYLFWDNLHPTQAAYQHIHDYLIEQIGPQMIIEDGQPLIPAILVFGDSTVDTGNNNYCTSIISPNRADHRSYGRDFPTHKPTGRFSNGKLVPDFLAHTLNLKDVVPPFLDPGLADTDLLTGVSFASGGSGYDDLTTVTTGAMPMSKQADYFRMYKERVSKVIGEIEAKDLIKKALVIIFAGTNDFTLNYYDLPTIRRLQYNITGYQDFVLEKLQDFLEELHRLGCRRMVVAGLPPVGCLPIQITSRLKIPRTCLDDQNSEAMSYNNKLLKLIPRIQTSLQGSQILYADMYTPMIQLLDNSQDYGIEVTDKGCCGTGYTEVGVFCNVLTPTCRNASEYLFWDSVHPTQAAYQHIHDYLIEQIGPQLIMYSSSSFAM
ncbi:hypothetical protein Cgig2_004002 [Carnegiea gigantea]|uniref:GDSL esterase/lipase n=1 Tax=Carnegiea gigantea TaxID=171969 RepID=A0A9Q1QFR8_9CARY|nr:hypothetical protein Cgig2_004002 [Carnegiea gigantea]